MQLTDEQTGKFFGSILSLTQRVKDGRWSFDELMGNVNTLAYAQPYAKGAPWRAIRAVTLEQSREDMIKDMVEMSLVNKDAAEWIRSGPLPSLVTDQKKFVLVKCSLLEMGITYGCGTYRIKERAEYYGLDTVPIEVAMKLRLEERHNEEFSCRMLLDSTHVDKFSPVFASIHFGGDGRHHLVPGYSNARYAWEITEEFWHCLPWREPPPATPIEST